MRRIHPRQVRVPHILRDPHHLEFHPRSAKRKIELKPLPNRILPREERARRRFADHRRSHRARQTLLRVPRPPPTPPSPPHHPLPPQTPPPPPRNPNLLSSL